MLNPCESYSSHRCGAGDASTWCEVRQFPSMRCALYSLLIASWVSLAQKQVLRRHFGAGTSSANEEEVVFMLYQDFKPQRRRTFKPLGKTQ
jgi:hypothetical protein